MLSPLEDLFKRALGLEDPWQIIETTFSEELQELNIYLDFKRGSRFICPKCKQDGIPCYDTKEKRWRHMNFFQHRTFLHCPAPRVECPNCGVKLVDLPWARSGSGFTLLFEALIMTLTREMPVKALSRMIGEHDTRIWRVVQYYVADARTREYYVDVNSVGIDETSLKRGHHYVTLFVDLDKSKVIFVTEGKDHGTVGKFSNDFHDHGGDACYVNDVCCDMSPAFIDGVERYLPNAQITFDRFHVMKIIGEAVDKVRRAEQKDKEELKRSRYIWLKNPENLTVKQRGQLDSLSESNLKQLVHTEFD